MRALLCCLSLCLFGSAVMAGGWGGSASITCGDASNPYRPVLNLTYGTGSDAGTPGLLGIAVLLPDMSDGAVYSDDAWVSFKGGLIPFASRFDNGFPPLIQRSIPFPGAAPSTAQFQGYAVFMGHGAYTSDARRRVEVMRDSLARNKQRLSAQGKWTAQMEASMGSDFELRYIWSLIQKDATDNQKFGQVFVIPFVDCSPSRTGR